MKGQTEKVHDRRALFGQGCQCLAGIAGKPVTAARSSHLIFPNQPNPDIARRRRCGERRRLQHRHVVTHFCQRTGQRNRVPVTLENGLRNQQRLIKDNIDQTNSHAVGFLSLST